LNYIVGKVVHCLEIAAYNTPLYKRYVNAVEIRGLKCAPFYVIYKAGREPTPYW
jgi:hypothetical protein